MIVTASAVAVLGSIAYAIGEISSPVLNDPLLPPSLTTVAVPEPPNLYDFVADKQAAIQLGKALFWDMKVGSDGVMACASCHFQAGADSRSINQVKPRDARARPRGESHSDLRHSSQHRSRCWHVSAA